MQYSGNCGPGMFDTTTFQVGRPTDDVASANVAARHAVNNAGGMRWLTSDSRSAGSAP